jgi:autotransporter-associated beta strand protein
MATVNRRAGWGRGVSVGLVALLAVLAGLVMAQAASLTWDADTASSGAQDGGGEWNTSGTNWWNGGGNVVWNNGTPDLALFGAGGTGSPTVTLTEPITVGTLTFNAGAAYTIAGGTLTLTGTSITVNSPEARIDSILAGTNMFKYGSGTLVLTGANTFGTNSAMDVRDGVLNLRHNNALGKSVYAHVFTSSSSALQVQDNITVSNGLYIKGMGVGGAGSLRSLSGDNVWAGPVWPHSENPNAAIGVDAGTLTISGVIGVHSGTVGSLAKVGAGTLILTNGNTYTGATRVNQGTLITRHATGLGTSAGGTAVADGATLGLENNITVAAEALTITGLGAGSAGALRNLSGNNTWNGPLTQSAARIAVDAGTLTINGKISGSGVLRKSGPGSLILTGDNDYAATTDVEAGVLNLRHNNALGTASYAHVYDQATLELQGGISVARGLYLGNANSAGTTLSLRNVSGNNTWAGPVWLHSSHSHARIGVESSTTLTISGVIAPHDGSTGSLTKVGAGTLVLSGANTYTGPTYVNEGPLNIRHDSALGATTAGTTVANGAQLQLQNNITVSGESLTLAGGTGLRNVSGNNTWAGPLAVATYSMVSVDAGSSLKVSGNLSGLRLDKVGPGTLILSGDNSATTQYADVSAGIVRLESDKSPLGAYFHVTNPAAVVELAGGITTPASKTVYLSGVASGSNPALRSASGVNTWGGPVVLHNGGAGNRNIGADAGSTLILNGSVSESTSGGVGPRNLVKVGDGTLDLRGVGAYTGSTVVTAGTLLVNNTSGSGTGSGNVLVDAGLLGGNGSIAGSVAVNPAGTISAGNSPGHLSIGGSYTQAGAMLVELGGTSQGATTANGYDWISVGGAATLDGTLRVKLLDGFQPQGNDKFYVFTASGGITDNGLDLTWDPADLLPAQHWDYRVASWTGGGQAVELFVGVPEPTAILLLALGAGVLTLWARRRQARDAGGVK